MHQLLGNVQQGEKNKKKTKTQPASHDPFVLWKTAHADFAAQISCNVLVNMHAAVG